MDPGNIPSCIETIIYIIFLNPAISYQELNRKLQSLGWPKSAIDEHTFQLLKLIAKLR